MIHDSASIPDTKTKQNQMRFFNHKKQLYPYGNSEPLKTTGCFMAEAAVGDVAVEAEFIVTERDSHTA